AFFSPSSSVPVPVPVPQLWLPSRNLNPRPPSRSPSSRFRIRTRPSRSVLRRPCPLYTISSKSTSVHHISLLNAQSGQWHALPASPGGSVFPQTRPIDFQRHST